MENKESSRLHIAVSAFTFLIFLFLNSNASAQIFNDSSHKYKIYVEPYIMFTSMSGTTAIGGLPPVSICIPASKVFSYLKIGGMLYVEVHNDKFAYTSDLFYANLSQDASSKNNVISGTADLKQFLWELEGLYRINPWLEAGVGARINDITSEINFHYNMITGGGSLTGYSKRSSIWVDPLIVARLKTVIHDKWLFQLRADMGGFGIGSQFAWQLQPDIFYRASKLLQLGIGYRAISVNYNNNKSGSDYFLYDMVEYGPQIRIGFNF